MRILRSFILSVCMVGIVFAAETGKIAGTVTSEDGTALTGANVIVEGTSFGAASDEAGNYYILNMPPGTYTVRVDFIGYKSVVATNVLVSVGLTTRQNFTLETTAVPGETVEIVAERPLVIMSATNAVRSMDAEQIDNFATRNVTDMLAIQAGVVSLNGLLHIRGSRPDEVGYELEGASTRAIGQAGVIQSGQQAGGAAGRRSPGTAGAYNLVGVIPEALEEISIQSGGYSADLGGANAGIVQQTLRTGGSKLTGYVRAESDALAPAFGNTLSYGANDLTASVSGPITSKVRIFGAVSRQTADDWMPQFWNGVTINKGEAMPDLIAGLTPSGDSVKISWDETLPQGPGGLEYYDHNEGAWKRIPAKTGARSDEKLNLNSTLLLDFNPVVFRLSGVYSSAQTRINDLPIFNMFNVDRLPQTDHTSLLLAAKGTYFLSPSTFVSLKFNTLADFGETYDPNFDHETATDWLVWADSVEIAKVNKDWAANWKSRYTPPDNFTINTFPFARPGDISSGYAKTEQSYVSLGGSGVSQQGAHEAKLGFDWRRWTVRRYGLSAGDLVTLNQSIRDKKISKDDITNETDDGAKALRDALVLNVGYDEFGNELNKGVDGARHPTLLSLYANDKFEIKDLVINAGLRVDQFNLDDFAIGDPSNPPYDVSHFSAYEDSLKTSDAKRVVQPRLGLAFPLSDRSVFHLQFGKFAQFPDLYLPFKSRALMAVNWDAHFFIRDPIAWNLDPIITTQYEVGYAYQLGDAAAFDVTAFAKNTEGQLVMEWVRAAPGIFAGDHTVYVNGDFTTASGVEFTLRTRRVNNVLATINYAFTDARGTNSFPNSNNGNINVEADPPTLITPLRYQERHRGSINLDLRYGSDAGLVLSNLGVNLLLTFNSGHSFTLSTGGMGQRDAYEGALLVDSDPRNRQPVESLGNSTTPWYFNTDLRIDKVFNLAGIDLSVYAIITNLFNRKHIVNVYNRTGDAYDDGFLTNPELSEKIVEAQGSVYEEMYREINLGHRQHWIADQGFDLFGTPRTVRVGVTVEY